MDSSQKLKASRSIIITSPKANPIDRYQDFKRVQILKNLLPKVMKGLYLKVKINMMLMKSNKINPFKFCDRSGNHLQMPDKRRNLNAEQASIENNELIKLEKLLKEDMNSRGKQSLMPSRELIHQLILKQCGICN